MKKIISLSAFGLLIMSFALLSSCSNFYSTLFPGETTADTSAIAKVNDAVFCVKTSAADVHVGDYYVPLFADPITGFDYNVWSTPGGVAAVLSSITIPDSTTLRGKRDVLNAVFPAGAWGGVAAIWSAIDVSTYTKIGFTYYLPTTISSPVSLSWTIMDSAGVKPAADISFASNNLTAGWHSVFFTIPSGPDRKKITTFALIMTKPGADQTIALGDLYFFN